MPHSHAWTCNYGKPVETDFASHLVFATVTVIEQGII